MSEFPATPPGKLPPLPAAEGGLSRHDGRSRCGWCGNDPLYITYHDTEWGVPEHREQRLFEMLILEGFQAGLSWITILKKRESFRAAFFDWDVERISRLSDAECAELLTNPGIIRNRAKIQAARKNAQAFLRVRQEFGSFDQYLWGFTGGMQICATPRRKNWREAPVSTDLSKLVSKDLIRRGFGFCGPVTIYSYLQAVGVVDDHISGCWRAVRK